METTEQKQMPSKSIDIVIGTNTYPIKFPNNGQLIDIEARKLHLTDGSHSNLAKGNRPAQQAYLLVEAITTFTVLIPDLAKDLNVSSLLELDPMQSKGLLTEYVKKYYPWFTKWMDIINENVE